MSDDHLKATLYVSYSTKNNSHFKIISALPTPIGKVAYKLNRHAAAGINEYNYKRSFTGDEGEIAYLFGETSPALAEWLHKRGVIVCREKVNTGKQIAKAILDDAYARLGLPPQHGISERDVALERERLNLASYVYCANDFVEASMVDYGLPPQKIIPTSRGFSPARLSGARSDKYGFKGPIFIFVGTVCVRKGAHLLLEAWRKAKTGGTLVFAGAVEPFMRERYGDLLDADDVVSLKYVEDVGSLYRSADVFIFPSLEEAGPKVTYEAAFCGLPCIVSPMGAGRIIRHGEEGLVVNDFDEDALVDAIRTLAADPELRKSMGQKGHEHSLMFSWDKVGGSRSKALQERILTSRSVKKVGAPSGEEQAEVLDS